MRAERMQLKTSGSGSSWVGRTIMSLHSLTVFQTPGDAPPPSPAIQFRVARSYSGQPESICSAARTKDTGPG